MTPYLREKCSYHTQGNNEGSVKCKGRSTLRNSWTRPIHPLQSRQNLRNICFPGGHWDSSTAPQRQSPKEWWDPPENAEGSGCVVDDTSLRGSLVQCQRSGRPGWWFPCSKKWLEGVCQLQLQFCGLRGPDGTIGPWLSALTGLVHSWVWSGWDEDRQL